MVFEDPYADLEMQLAPFHEFECTGYDDEYVQEIDETEEVLGRFAQYQSEGSRDPLQKTLDWFGYECPVEDDNYIERKGSHKYRWAVVQNGKIVKATRRTNPNKKWDWWQVGGRWSGFLRLKDGSQANSAKKSEIDWEAMRNLAGEEAGELWDEIRELAPDGWESWDSVRGRFGEGNIEEARKFYHSQTGREIYVERARKRAVTPFAMLKEGEWIERGKMGWWATVSNEMTENDWYDKVWETIQSVADETVITVVDCHI